MKRITKYDNQRKAEITLIMNNFDDVIGAEVYFPEPIPIIDFSLTRINQKFPLVSMPPSPPSGKGAPTYNSSQRSEIKGQDKSQITNRPCGGGR